MPVYWRKGLTFLCVFFLLWFFVRFLLPLFIPFLMGAGLAAASEPAAGRLTRLRVPRSVSAVIAVTMTLGTLAVIILLLAGTALHFLSSLAGNLPRIASLTVSGIEQLQIFLLRLAGRLPQELQAPTQSMIQNIHAGSTALLERCVHYVLGLAGGVLCSIPGSALSIATTLIAGYMICAEKDTILARLRAVIPEKRAKSLHKKLQSLRSTALQWLLSQAKLSAVTFAILCAGLLLLRIRYAIAAAAIICLLDAFPVLGVGTVLMPWALVRFLQEDGARAAGLLGLYVTVALVRSVLEPKFVGKHLGLDPLLTLAALYGGFRLWGVAGMMLMPLVTVGAVTFTREGQA